MPPAGFADALGSAAKHGVDVRFLYDPIGTLNGQGQVDRTDFERGGRRRTFVPAAVAVQPVELAAHPASRPPEDAGRRRCRRGTGHNNHLELNLLIADPVTGAAMRAMFECDLATATRVDPASGGSGRHGSVRSKVWRAISARTFESRENRTPHLRVIGAMSRRFARRRRPRMTARPAPAFPACAADAPARRCPHRTRRRPPGCAVRARRRNVASVAAKATITNGMPSSAASCRKRSRCQRCRKVASTIAMSPAATTHRASARTRW